MAMQGTTHFCKGCVFYEENGVCEATGNTPEEMDFYSRENDYDCYEAEE